MPGETVTEGEDNSDGLAGGALARAEGESVDFGRPQFDGFQLDAPHPLAVVDPPERHPETAVRSTTKTVHAATEENRMISASFTGNQEKSKYFARPDAPKHA